MQLTIDSTEALDRVLRVVESLYGVELSVTEKAAKAKPAQAPGTARKASPAKKASAAKKTSPAKKATAKKATAKKATIKKAAAKKATRSPAAKRASSRTRGTSDAATVRNWARANGQTVRSRGRVPAEILAAYQAAH
jgi:Lsr2